VTDVNVVFSRVRGGDSVGGLVGYFGGANLLRSKSNGLAVIGTSSNVGGLVGQVSNSSVSDLNDLLVDVGSVVGLDGVGGVFGYVYNWNGYVIRLFRLSVRNLSLVSGRSYVGGLVGQASQSTVGLFDSNAVFGRVYSTGGYVGGLAGQSGSVSNCFATTVVDVNKSTNDGVGYVGGLVGSALSNISNSWSDSNVSLNLGVYGGTRVGGLAGSVSGNVSFSFFRGSFVLNTKTGSNMSGGLVGRVDGRVSDSNAVFVDVNGLGNVGGLAGYVYSTGSLLLRVKVVGLRVSGSGDSVGGLVGYLYGGGVSDANDLLVDVNSVVGVDNVGGVVGNVYNPSGQAIRLFRLSVRNLSLVSGRSYVGGLVGTVYHSAVVVSDSNAVLGRVYSTGGYAGGLAGQVGSVSNCFATTVVDVNKRTNDGAGHSGGLVGNALGSISNSWSDSNVNTDLGLYSGPRVGGLVGSVSGNVSFSFFRGSFVLGVKTGGSDIGGLVGYSTGSISNSSALLVDVNGLNHVGGLLGQVSGNVTDVNVVFSRVRGGDSVGGLVGYFGGANLFRSKSNGLAVIGTSSNVGGLVGQVSTWQFPYVIDLKVHCGVEQTDEILTYRCIEEEKDYLQVTRIVKENA
jgi:hypothetical protein